MAGNYYYYLFGGKVFGPLPASDLTQALNSLPHPKNSFVWRIGLATWTPAGSLPEISRFLWPTVQPQSVAQLRPVAGRLSEMSIAPQAFEVIGDSRGEYLTMWHGPYSAWFYVYVAFLGQIFLPIGILALIVLSAPDINSTVGEFLLTVLTAANFALTLWIYNDRWRCIEAHTSRTLSGWVNFSILYSPIVAFLYANKRGIEKLGGQ